MHLPRATVSTFLWKSRARKNFNWLHPSPPAERIAKSRSMPHRFSSHWGSASIFDSRALLPARIIAGNRSRFPEKRSGFNAARASARSSRRKYPSIRRERSGIFFPKDVTQSSAPRTVVRAQTVAAGRRGKDATEGIVNGDQRTVPRCTRRYCVATMTFLRRKYIDLRYHVLVSRKGSAYLADSRDDSIESVEKFHELAHATYRQSNRRNEKDC